MGRVPDCPSGARTRHALTGSNAPLASIEAGEGAFEPLAAGVASRYLRRSARLASGRVARYVRVFLPRLSGHRRPLRFNSCSAATAVGTAPPGCTSATGRGRDHPASQWPEKILEKFPWPVDVPRYRGENLPAQENSPRNAERAPPAGRRATVGTRSRSAHGVNVYVAGPPGAGVLVADDELAGSVRADHYCF